MFYSLHDSIEHNYFITPWSFIHLLYGGLSILILKEFKINFLNSFIILLIAHTIWEIKDLYPYFMKINNVASERDNSLLNSIGDTLFWIIGIIIFNNYKLNRNELLIILGLIISIHFVCINLPIG